jgi:hypothetical protein
VGLQGAADQGEEHEGRRDRREGLTALLQQGSGHRAVLGVRD